MKLVFQKVKSTVPKWQKYIVTYHDPDLGSTVLWLPLGVSPELLEDLFRDCLEQE